MSPMFIPTGQNLEDVLLWRCFNGIENGTYIDVGAGEFGQPSVTQSFYDLGWNGVLIDPIPHYEKEYRLNRPRDIYISGAAGASPSDNALFYELQGGLSTLSHATLKLHESAGLKYQTHSVVVQTLSNIWESHQLTEVHFLKVDVEGFEMQVLNGLDLNKYRPRVILVEVAIPGTTSKSDLNFTEYFEKFNYHFVYNDGLNDFFVSNEHATLKEYFSIPINVGDGPWFISSSELRSRTLQQKQYIAFLENEVKRLRRPSTRFEMLIHGLLRRSR